MNAKRRDHIFQKNSGNHDAMRGTRHSPSKKRGGNRTSSTASIL
ncbi:hypothetical protein [Methylovirgula sp. HY1]|nr:hypothetical protein [Methylovirgula sp. HY1]